MTKEEHASQIATEAHDLIYKKYLKGALKHGGNIQKKLMVPHAIEEAVDQMVYLLTLKEQWGEMVVLAESVITELKFGVEAAYIPSVKLRNMLVYGNTQGVVETELEGG